MNTAAKEQKTIITLNGNIRTYHKIISALSSAGFQAEKSIVSEEGYGDYPLILEGTFDNTDVVINICNINAHRIAKLMKELGFVADKHYIIGNPERLPQRIFNI